MPTTRVALEQRADQVSAQLACWPVQYGSSLAHLMVDPASPRRRRMFARIHGGKCITAYAAPAARGSLSKRRRDFHRFFSSDSVKPEETTPVVDQTSNSHIGTRYQLLANYRRSPNQLRQACKSRRLSEGLDAACPGISRHELTPPGSCGVPISHSLTRSQMGTNKWHLDTLTQACEEGSDGSA